MSELSSQGSWHFRVSAPVMLLCADPCRIHPFLSTSCKAVLLSAMYLVPEPWVLMDVPKFYYKRPGSLSPLGLPLLALTPVPKPRTRKLVRNLSPEALLKEASDDHDYYPKP